MESEWDGDKFVAHNVPYKNVLLNGLAPDTNHIEYQRRQIEIQEEDRVESYFKSGELNSTNAILTISPFPDEMSHTEAKKSGYDTDSSRYFIRWHEVNDAGDRKTKSLAMNNSDSQTLSRVITKLNGRPEASNLKPTEILGTQVIVDKEDFENITDIAELIDDLSGGLSFGEHKPDRPDYDNLEKISALHEMKAAAEIESFTDQMIDIARNGRDPESILEAYKELTERTIMLIVMDQPELAVQTVGAKAAKGLKKVKKQIESGDYAGGMGTFEATKADVTPMYMCGMEINNSSSSSNESLSSLLESLSSPIKILKCVNCPLCRRKGVDAEINKKKNYIKCRTCKGSKPLK